MFIPSTFKRPVSSWKALNLRKTLLMASSVRLKPLNCSRLPCVYAQETLTFLLTQKKTCVKNYVQRSEERFSRNAETDLVCRLLLEKKKKKKEEKNYYQKKEKKDRNKNKRETKNEENKYDTVH